MKVGITGQTGFIGAHLYNLIELDSLFEPIVFENNYFQDDVKLREFVKQCDIIVHLAAVNRHRNPQVVYDTNIELVEKLICAMSSEGVSPHVLFSSSTQESLDSVYGGSKRVGRELFESWAEENSASFTGLIIPNVFGEFARPNHNTFIATFAHKLLHGERPTVIVDNKVQLIYVGSLCRFIASRFNIGGVNRVDVPYDFQKSVTEVLNLFEYFTEVYIKQGATPELNDINEINLFNTFRSYI